MRLRLLGPFESVHIRSLFTHVKASCCCEPVWVGIRGESGDQILGSDSLHLQTREADHIGVIPEDVIVAEAAEHQDKKSLPRLVGNLVDGEESDDDEEEKDGEGGYHCEVYLLHDLTTRATLSHEADKDGASG